MITRRYLAAEELRGIIAAVMEYNGLTAGEIHFYGADGQEIELQGVDVFCEEKQGLKVRTAPDKEGESPEGLVAQMAAQEEAAILADPKKASRQVSPPMGIAGLKKLVED